MGRRCSRHWRNEALQYSRQNAQLVNRWEIKYEGIQADIFDHLLAAAPEFDLKIFQNPTGHDFQAALNIFSKFKNMMSS